MSNFTVFPLKALKSLGVSTKTGLAHVLIDLQRQELTENRETEQFKTAWPKQLHGWDIN
jgi:hypothetical protein